MAKRKSKTRKGRGRAPSKRRVAKDLDDVLNLPRPNGRPRTDFDLEQVEKLAALGASAPQIANWFSVDLSTVQRRKRDDEEFKAAVERGANRARVRLQAAQYDTAVVRRNPTMQIWLGQQMLGQRNFKSVEHSGPGGGPIAYNIQDARTKLTALLERQIKKAEAATEGT